MLVGCGQFAGMHGVVVKSADPVVAFTKTGTTTRPAYWVQLDKIGGAVIVPADDLAFACEFAGVDPMFAETLASMLLSAGVGPQG